MKLAVVITMAGAGSRFSEAGYCLPKYRIVAHGRSLFSWSLLSLRSFIDAGCRFVFVVRRRDAARDFIRGEAASLGVREMAIVELDGLTDGQASSAMLARPELLDEADGVGIFNIDTHVRPGVLSIAAIRGDGWVPCFRATGAGWSFAAIGVAGRIRELREKQRISEFATLGFYYFSSFGLFKEAYDACQAHEAGERYVAPLYNYLIARDLPVFAELIECSDVVALGTPADLLKFDPAALPERTP